MTKALITHLRFWRLFVATMTHSLWSFKTTWTILRSMLRNPRRPPSSPTWSVEGYLLLN